MSRQRRARVGVLALQGDVREHVRILDELSAEIVLVRTPIDLAGVEALVLPGGESTTISMLLESSGLRPGLAALFEQGIPALGTCAGMILLAREVIGARTDQVSFGAIDLVVRRNAFGRQIESFEADLDLAGIKGGPFHGVFIRAPIVESVGEGVAVLATVRFTDGIDRPVVCRQGMITVAAFHPELASDDRLHRLLLADVDHRRGLARARLSEHRGAQSR